MSEAKRVALQSYREQQLHEREVRQARSRVSRPRRSAADVKLARAKARYQHSLAQKKRSAPRPGSVEWAKNIRARLNVNYRLDKVRAERKRKRQP